MASSSAFVIPLTLFFVGTRLWALGKRHGFMTPVQMFRDRWECGHIGTVIFVVQAALLVPYIIIGVMGGGTALRAISGGLVPVLARRRAGRAGRDELRVLRRHARHRLGQRLSDRPVPVVRRHRARRDRPRHGRVSGARCEALLASPATAPLLTRERISPLVSSSATRSSRCRRSPFRTSRIFCLTAQRLVAVQATVILYPLCMLAIWLPCVFLGVVANRATDVPRDRGEARGARRRSPRRPPTCRPDERAALRRQAAGDDVILRHAGSATRRSGWPALLGAGIMAAVMASDSQILALSTMFTEDVFAFYGGKARFGEARAGADGPGRSSCC